MRPTGPPPVAPAATRLGAATGCFFGAAGPRDGAAAAARCSRTRRGLRCLSALGRVVELEEGDALVHGLGLMLQRLGGGGVLLDQRRVLLRHLVHLGERLVDLLDAARLLGAGVGDVGDDRRPPS